MQTYRNISNYKIYERYYNPNEYWCSFEEIPTHFDISPISLKILEDLCNTKNMFIEKFVNLENSLLLQVKMYFCNKITQQQAINNIINIHSEMRTLFHKKFIIHHQELIDNVKHKVTNTLINNMIDNGTLCSSL